jgi:hypothetical protein
MTVSLMNIVAVTRKLPLVMPDGIVATASPLVVDVVARPFVMRKDPLRCVQDAPLDEVPSDEALALSNVSR